MWWPWEVGVLGGMRALGSAPGVGALHCGSPARLLGGRPRARQTRPGDWGAGHGHVGSFGEHSRMREHPHLFPGDSPETDHLGQC